MNNLYYIADDISSIYHLKDNVYSSPKIYIFMCLAYSFLLVLEKVFEMVG